jgi:hypothetical protein
VVDVGDDIGTIHYHLYGMQSNTDNACVDHVKLEDDVEPALALSVNEILEPTQMRGFR